MTRPTTAPTRSTLALTPSTPRPAVGTGVGIGIKEDNVKRRADAKTAARGGCGPFLAEVVGDTTTKVRRSISDGASSIPNAPGGFSRPTFPIAARTEFVYTSRNR